MSHSLGAHVSKDTGKLGRFDTLWVCIYLALLAALAVVHFRHNIAYALDDSFITYRYAYNFVNGDGLTFNVDERHFGSTAVGFAILVGVVGKLLCLLDSLVSSSPSLDLFGAIPLVARAISSISLAVAAWVLSCMAWSWFGRILGSAIALVVAAVLFLENAGSRASGHETYTYISMCLVASYLAICCQHRLWAAVTLVLATCVRPDAMLFAAVMFCVVFSADWAAKSFRTSLVRILPAGLLYAVGLGAWLGIMGWYYGHPLPETMVAKQAQVLLGHWRLFKPETVWKDIVESLPTALPWVCVAGVVASPVWFFLGRKHRESTNEPALLGAVWLIFGVGLVSAYTLLRVTYWSWYGVPVWFTLTVLLVPALYVVTRAVCVNRAIFGRAGVALVLVAMLAIDRGLLMQRLKVLCFDRNTSGHIGSYGAVIDYLKANHPAGISLATAEPGHIGFMLGRNFKVIDSLGLTSPHVARAIVQGDMDFPFRTWKPEYVVASWTGKYNPVPRPWFGEQYSLVKKFSHPFWEKYIKGPYSLYRRSEAASISSGDSQSQSAVLNAGVL